MNIRICLLTSLLVLCSSISSTSMAVGTGYSDDTELFIYDFAKAGDFRPKVLFIFDNSGSMGDTTLLAKAEYDPEFSYPRLTNDDGNNNYIYYSTNGTPPQIVDSNNTKRFLKNKNACATSQIAFNEFGLFSSVYWNYVVSGSGSSRKGEWKPLKNYTVNSINIVDCQQDISEKNNDNSGFTNSYQSVSGSFKGYPVNRTNNTNISTPWVDSVAPTPPNTGGG